GERLRRRLADVGQQGEQGGRVVAGQEQAGRGGGGGGLAQAEGHLHVVILPARQTVSLRARAMASAAPGVGGPPSSSGEPKRVPSGIQAAKRSRKAKNIATSRPSRSKTAACPKESSRVVCGRSQVARARKRRGS